MNNDPNQPQQPPYGQPQQPLSYGQPPYGQPQQSPYGQPPYGQPQQTPYETPPTQYAPQPAYGPPQYNVPPAPNYGPPQQPPKRRRRWLWIVLGIVGVLVLACVGGVLLVVNAVTHNGATDVANQYYMAIEHQDYATAFTYLDTSNIALSGQALTRDLYIKANQVVDIQKGKVSSYSITNISLNSNNGVNTAALTVSVTRNGSPYDVHLKLRQESNGWKITGVDNI